MIFWLGFAAGLVVEGLAIWAICVWADRHERKELESRLPEVRSFIEVNPLRFELRVCGMRLSHHTGPSHYPQHGEYL